MWVNATNPFTKVAKPIDIAIRPATAADAGDLLAIYAPYVRDTAITFEISVPTPAEFSRRIQDISAGYPYLLCRIDGKTVGYAYAHRHMEREAYRWNAELSVYIHESRHGVGIGRALYLALLRILELQNIKNAYALITIPNEASVRLHRSLGFSELSILQNTGYKHGRWHSVMWMERKISAYDLPPGHVIPFPALSQEALDAVYKNAADSIKLT